MFPGNTTLQLNMATVQEALEEYLASRVDAGTARFFKVTGVSHNSSNYTFDVKIEEVSGDT